MSEATRVSTIPREAPILEYWKAVELFSPQRVPRLNPNSRREPVFRAGGETPLPWFWPGGFRPPEPNKLWRYTAYCGLFRLNRVRSRLERAFGRDHGSFDLGSNGESCLFAVQIGPDGRPLLDTFVLASCTWATGRLRSPGPQSSAWLNGFESAAREESLRFAERFALREDDELGRELNRNPDIRVGRPIQPFELESEIRKVAASLGVRATLEPRGLRIACHQVFEKQAWQAEGDDFLNSFFLRDLERIASEATHGNLSSPLTSYLAAPTEPRPQGAAFERIDVRESLETLWQELSPERFPVGRWPADVSQSLYSSQQFAVNAALGTLPTRTSSIFGINGPPGTGKTTLLRELIAAIVVRRAHALAALEKPEQAFEPVAVQWSSGRDKRTVWLWRDQLLGFEMVVASANNRAVENVTLEIPGRGAVGDEWLAHVDYFGDFAARLLGESNPAWGLIAARLGSKRNRRTFRNRFWFENKEAPEPRCRADRGFWRYLQRMEPEPERWKQAVQSFQDALEAESQIRKDRVAAFNAVDEFHRIIKDLDATRQRIPVVERQIDETRNRVTDAEQHLANCRAALEDALSARRAHREFKPGLVDALFSRGKTYDHWQEKDALLEAKQDQSTAALERAKTVLEEQLQARRDAESELANLQTKSTALDHRKAELNDQLSKWPGMPSLEGWVQEATDTRELSSPWVDEGWNRARTRVFLEALHLHRTFLECVPDRMKTNLMATMDLLSGKIPPQLDSRAFRSAWASLFFVVPVVSTTFASFDRLFAHLGRESIGWLLIDEAAQATPQSAVGALWRSQRALILGDPRQLEPILPLPFTAQQALRAHFGVDETWIPSSQSVQSLADRVSRLGTWLRSHDSDERIWVGAPLRVHSRCEKPMFDIANQIAYGGQMVYATREIESPLPGSGWMDTGKSEAEDHWIPTEGMALEILLHELLLKGARPSDILLISPFRAVAKKLREVGSRYDIPHAGTIHVAQGREAPVVILVLGGDPRRPGAKEWASSKPNLLNVAVSRARQRLYIIGDRDEWSQYPHFADAAVLIRPPQPSTRSVTAS